MKHKRIHDAIDKFLAVKVTGDGQSWPNPSKEDMQALYDLFRNIIDAKFGRDCDGDSVINFAIVNRKKHLPLHHYPIGYPDKARSGEELLRIIDLQQCQISGAAEMLRHSTFCLRSSMEDAAKRNMSLDKYLEMVNGGRD